VAATASIHQLLCFGYSSPKNDAYVRHVDSFKSYPIYVGMLHTIKLVLLVLVLVLGAIVAMAPTTGGASDTLAASHRKMALMKAAGRRCNFCITKLKSVAVPQQQAPIWQSCGVLGVWSLCMLCIRNDNGALQCPLMTAFPPQLWACRLSWCDWPCWVCFMNVETCIACDCFG
jgi:hypothetical protein